MATETDVLGEFARLCIKDQLQVRFSLSQPDRLRIADAFGCGDSAGVYDAHAALEKIKAVKDTGDAQENWQAVWDALNQLDPEAPWDFD